MCVDKLLLNLISDGKKEYLYVPMLIGNCMYYRGGPHVSREIGLKYDAGDVMFTNL